MSADDTTHSDGTLGAFATQDDDGRHDLELRDVVDGTLHVSYNRVTHGLSHTQARFVSGRLPIACLALFDGGSIDVADLSAEERAWIEWESERIAFEGVPADGE